VFGVISVYFNVRNILPKSGTSPPGHPVYCKMIHGPYSSKLITAQQAKKVHKYENIKIKKEYSYSRKMFNGRAEPFRIIGYPDNQSPDKWNSTVS